LLDCRRDSKSEDKRIENSRRTSSLDGVIDGIVRSRVLMVEGEYGSRPHTEMGSLVFVAYPLCFVEQSKSMIALVSRP
jgi:hypothetical protein